MKKAIVIGAGHAGCEAGLILAKQNIDTTILCLNLDSVGFLACNPSIGGTAKGHLVCEIDALGGQIGKCADETLIQIRMLNLGKGPAVQSLRAQVDKNSYHYNMKSKLENQSNLHLRQAEAVEILTQNNKVCGVITAQGETLEADAVIICTGVYLKSDIIVGEYKRNCGPNGFSNSDKLSENLAQLGFEIFRFKTGTPARVHLDSINKSALEIQYGDDNIQNFSFMTKERPKNISECYLTYTTKKTKDIIMNNLDICPMLSGSIVGIGPRYCPSIESKIIRFADKERHQVFLEPEALDTKEMYVQGVSTSMPVDIQKQIYHSVIGLENVEIMRDAYAIEYDCINSTQLLPTLEYKNIENLYCAGQINGSSGYEEAAAQGIVAGINCGQKLNNKPPLVLQRNRSYIGVLIDDLVTKGTDEPYRMMTSRAEYRLNLRQDNADFRLTPLAIQCGIIDKERVENFTQRLCELNYAYSELSRRFRISELETLFTERNESLPKAPLSLTDIIKRNNITASDCKKYLNVFQSVSEPILNTISINIKYEGYIKKEKIQIQNFERHERVKIPQDIDYLKINGLRIEARQKLDKIKPINLGQAGRISGVSPADIAVLMCILKK